MSRNWRWQAWVKAIHLESFRQRCRFSQQSSCYSHSWTNPSERPLKKNNEVCWSPIEPFTCSTKWDVSSEFGPNDHRKDALVVDSYRIMELVNAQFPASKKLQTLKRPSAGYILTLRTWPLIKTIFLYTMIYLFLFYDLKITTKRVNRRFRNIVLCKWFRLMEICRCDVHIVARKPIFCYHSIESKRFHHNVKVDCTYVVRWNSFCIDNPNMCAYVVGHLKVLKLAPTI